MFGKQNLPRVLFIVLLSALLLTAAVLVKDGLAGAGESERAFVSTEAEVQGSGGAGETRREGDREMGRQGEGEIVPLSQEPLRTSAPLPLSTAAQTRTVTYTYDDAGRLVGVDYGEGNRTNYTYDAAGNLLQREVLLSLTGVEISGPATGLVDIAATFTATVSPITPTLPVTYTWQATDQTVVTHTVHSVSDSVAFTWPVTGSKAITVTAVNPVGAVVSDTHAITITTNQPPVAHAGPDQSVQVNALVTLDGSDSTDPDGHLPLAYGWTQTGGISVTLSDGTAVSPTFTAPATPAVLTFTLTVTDALGLADPTPDEVVITVTDVPITGLSAENSSPTTLGEVTFFTATIAAGSNVTYRWAFGDDGTDTGMTVSHTYAAAGPYTAVVTASNAAGQVIATTPVTITNAAPVADAGPDQSVIVGAEVMLDGSGSYDPDGHLPLTYGWAQIGGPTVGGPWSTAIVTFTAPDIPTVLTFTLVVTDAYGLADPTPDTVAITVEGGERYIYVPLVLRNVAPWRGEHIPGREKEYFASLEELFDFIRVQLPGARGRGRGGDKGTGRQGDRERGRYDSDRED